MGYPFIPSDDWFAARRLTQGSPINFNDTVLASESFPSQDHSLVPTPTVHTPAINAVLGGQLGGLDSVSAPLDQPATNIRQRRFECPSPTCPRAFDRLSRAQDCLNQHRNVTHSCNAACGEPNCSRKYKSVEHLERHVRPKKERRTPCPSCNKHILRQNLARHRACCNKRTWAKQMMEIFGQKRTAKSERRE